MSQSHHFTNIPEYTKKCQTNLQRQIVCKAWGSVLYPRTENVKLEKKKKVQQWLQYYSSEISGIVLKKIAQ